MCPSPTQGSGSLLLAEEYFGAEDPRFLEAIRAVSAPAALAGFVDRWKRDPRPFARAQVLAYLAQPLDCLGHNVVVKRLFKQAEAAGDDELMAAFLVAFDVLVRRVRKTRQRYNWQTREVWTEESLVTPRDVLPREATLKARNPRTGAEMSVPARVPKSGRLFSHRTRNYLRRRAWRYFRRLGFQHPERYLPAIARALAAYKDDDLAKGEHILDSWGLVHACFRKHAALEFTAARLRLREGRAISELTPAPRFAALWRTPEAARTLLALVATARSRLVRLWAMELMRREHEGRLAGIPLEDLFRLLEHADEEVQQFGARLLEASSEVATLPVAAWFKLLSTQNTLALEAVCRAFQRHVAGERLTLADCVRLACAAPSPVARLGLGFLRAREIVSAEQREAISHLSDARSAATAGELAAWALGILGTAETYDRGLVLRFFDSHSAPVRQSAWQWLVGEAGGLSQGDYALARRASEGTTQARRASEGTTLARRASEGITQARRASEGPAEDPSLARRAGVVSPGYADPGLWCRLLETPYDDLRLPLVDELARRASLPAGRRDSTQARCASEGSTQARCASEGPAEEPSLARRANEEPSLAHRAGVAQDIPAVLPGAGADELAPLWCSVLLGVHRGGRQKVKATRQIARALADDPSRAEKLLPVLAVAVRSVRPAEARAGLAALVAAVEARPELRTLVQEYLPELRWEGV